MQNVNTYTLCEKQPKREREREYAQIACVYKACPKTITCLPLLK